MGGLLKDKPDLKVLSFPQSAPSQQEDCTSEDILSIIEELGSLAAANPVKSIAVVGTYEDGTIFKVYNTGGQLFTLIGGVESLKHRLHSEAEDVE